jgi:hypothetical protein
MPEPRLTGSMVQQHLSILEEKLGREAVDTALEALPPEKREELTQTLPVGWVSFDALESLYDRLGDTTGRSVAALHREVVREGIERNAKTLWRVMLQAGSDEALAQRTPLIFSKGYSAGKLTCELTGPGQAKLQVSEWPGIREFALRGMQVGFERLVEIAGRRGVRATAKPVKDGAELMIRWQLS